MIHEWWRPHQAAGGTGAWKKLDSTVLLSKNNQNDFKLLECLRNDSPTPPLRLSSPFSPWTTSNLSLSLHFLSTQGFQFQKQWVSPPLQSGLSTFLRNCQARCFIYLLIQSISKPINLQRFTPGEENPNSGIRSFPEDGLCKHYRL